MGLADIEGLLTASIGLNVASIGSSAVARAVEERSVACHLAGPDAYWERLRGSHAELQALIEVVVVPETWFFRDSESFAALARLVREEWMHEPGERVIRLLSLPCSTGEEPYSMAMALLDAAVPADRFRVDAVDISTRALAQAGGAMYGKNSFRGRELTFRDRYFEASAQGYRLAAAVRRQVQFQPGNMFAADFLPGVELYDVIFCRNVLIYFDRATQDRAILVLKRLLTAKGALFVAPAETGLPSSHGFVSVNLPLSFAFRREAAVPRAPKRAAAPIGPLPVRHPVTTPPAPLHVAHESSASRPADLAARLPADEPDDLKQAAQLADQGHFVEAANRCEGYLRQHEPSATAFYLMGLVRDATGNHTEAGAYYRKTLYLEPNHVEAQSQLALLMEKQGNSAGAQILRNRTRRLEQRKA
jgi:chemotaxis protein methyltransferase WspC